MAEDFLLPPNNSDKKTLVLDLDETLVHSQFGPFDDIKSDIIIKINIDEEIHDIHVLVRPGVKEFLEKVSKKFEVVIFTASISKYASPLLDILDKNNLCSFRLYRDHCTLINNTFVKELKKLGRDLKNVIIVDNSPVAYCFDNENGIPILTWFDDKTDRELYKLCPILEFLSMVPDVRTYIKKIVEDNILSYNKAMKVINEYNEMIEKQIQEENKISNDDNKEKEKEKEKQNQQSISINIINNNITNYIYDNKNNENNQNNVNNINNIIASVNKPRTTKNKNKENIVFSVDKINKIGKKKNESMDSLKNNRVIIKNKQPISHKKSGSDPDLKKNNKIRINVNYYNNNFKSLSSSTKSNRSTKNNKISFKLNTSNVESKSIRSHKNNSVSEKYNVEFIYQRSNKTNLTSIYKKNNDLISLNNYINNSSSNQNFIFNEGNKIPKIKQRNNFLKTGYIKNNNINKINIENNNFSSIKKINENKQFVIKNINNNSSTKNGKSLSSSVDKKKNRLKNNLSLGNNDNLRAKSSKTSTVKKGSKNKNLKILKDEIFEILERRGITANSRNDAKNGNIRSKNDASKKKTNNLVERNIKK